MYVRAYIYIRAAFLKHNYQHRYPHLAFAYMHVHLRVQRKDISRIESIFIFIVCNDHQVDQARTSCLQHQYLRQRLYRALVYAYNSVCACTYLYIHMYMHM